MVTRKDFNKAAIRLFSDMILADGFIVKEELVYLARVAKDYKLSSAASPSKKRIVCDESETVFSGFDGKMIQEARKLTFAGAIEIIKEWKEEHRADVNNLVKQLAELSEIDGECSPKEAGIRLSIQYALEKDAIVFSVNKDYRFSRNEIIYIENDIHNATILNKIKNKVWENENSDIWIGFDDYRESHKNKEVHFSDFLSSYYYKINEDLDLNFYHYKRELKLLGFDLVYIPQTINKLNSFGDRKELIMPSLQIINPFKLYGKEFDSVVKALSDIKTYDFTNALLHSHQDLIAEATPSLLVKMGNSKIIDTSNKNIISYVQYSDFIIVKIENGSLKYTLDKFQSNYLALTKRLTHVVSEFYDSRINIHGFDRTLLEFAVNRVYGLEIIKRIVFDFVKSSVFFEFCEGSSAIPLQLSARGFAFFLLIMYKAIPQPIMNDIDFDTAKELRQKYPKLYQMHKECSKIYESIEGARKRRMCLFRKGVLQGSKNEVITAINLMPSFPNKEMFIPKLQRKEAEFDVNRKKIDLSVVFVKGEYGKFVPLNEWWKEKMTDI